MQVRWTTQAATSLEQIGDYIAEANPQAAHEVVNTIYQRVQQLADFPSLGRLGRLAGTRELVIQGLPYFVAYRVKDEVVEILDVIHTSRRFPPRS
jgi:toxin ParE1/3/4